MVTTIQDQELLEYAQECAGNWRKFDSFAWFNKPEDSDDWAIFYTNHRDSDSIARSNASVIAKLMEGFDESEVIAEDHNHWAVGWIKGYAIRCLVDGEPTQAIAKWKEIQDRLKEYPVLNEEHLSQLESEEVWRYLVGEVGYALRKCERTSKVCSGDPEDAYIASEVYRWLDENEPGQLEHDGNSPVLDTESVEHALVELGYLLSDDE